MTRSSVRVFGQDLTILRGKAEEVKRVLSGIEGIEDPRVAAQSEEPTLEIEVDLEAAERYEIVPGDVRRAAATLLSGIQVGSLFDEQKVFDVVVWGTPEVRHDLSSVEDLSIDLPAGGQVRLGDVANVRIGSSPTVIRHVDVSRSIDVTASVSGRDLSAVADDVREGLRGVEFPMEYHATVVGDFAAGQAADREALGFAIGAAIAVLLLVQAAIGNWRLAALVFLMLPLSSGRRRGRRAARRRRHLDRFDRRVPRRPWPRCPPSDQPDPARAAPRASAKASRSATPSSCEAPGNASAPILTSFFTTALVFAPFAIAGRIPGLEIVQPMAAVILGGLVSTTLLTLFIVPALYRRFGAQSEPDLSVGVRRTDGGPDQARGFRAHDLIGGEEMLHRAPMDDRALDHRRFAAVGVCVGRGGRGGAPRAGDARADRGFGRVAPDVDRGGGRPARHRGRPGSRDRIGDDDPVRGGVLHGDRRHLDVHEPRAPHVRPRADRRRPHPRRRRVPLGRPDLRVWTSSRKALRSCTGPRPASKSDIEGTASAMMRWIVASSIRLRFIVVAMAAGMMVYGFTQLQNTPLDVFPEFAPPQVEIQTISLGLSSTDVESLVTVPLEEALNGVPGLETIRSRSVSDLSSIQLLFKPGTDLLEARQLVSERVRIVTPSLPTWAAPPVMMPPVSATRRVMHVGLSSDSVSLIEMSTTAYWKIRARLLRVPGVANVAIWANSCNRCTSRSSRSGSGSFMCRSTKS